MKVTVDYKKSMSKINWDIPNLLISKKKSKLDSLIIVNSTSGLNTFYGTILFKKNIKETIGIHKQFYKKDFKLFTGDITLSNL